jgi:hypothetical protein
MKWRNSIIDTSNEIVVIFHLGGNWAETDAGSKTELQHQVMIEAVENHILSDYNDEMEPNLKF